MEQAHYPMQIMNYAIWNSYSTITDSTRKTFNVNMNDDQTSMYDSLEILALHAHPKYIPSMISNLKVLSWDIHSTNSWIRELAENMLKSNLKKNNFFYDTKPVQDRIGELTRLQSPSLGKFYNPKDRWYEREKSLEQLFGMSGKLIDDNLIQAVKLISVKDNDMSVRRTATSMLLSQKYKGNFSWAPEILTTEFYLNIMRK
jgi:hypothetical protein